MATRIEKGKLRRQRKFASDAAIQSRLPDMAAPHSRRYARKAALLPGEVAVAAPAEGLTLDRATNRIVCGDSVTVLRQLPSDWCACAVTSPPYWHTVDYGAPGQIGLAGYDEYLCDLDRVWTEIERVLIPNGKFCLNVPILPLTKQISQAAFGPSHTRVLLDLYSDIRHRIERNTSLKLYSLYIWEKQTTEKMFGSYPFPPNLYERNFIEFIAVFVKPGSPRVLPPAVKEASRISQSDWMDLTQQVCGCIRRISRELEGHPAPFPEALPNRLIAMYTFAAAGGFGGDIVLDPFAGSGTTCVAAKRLNRRFIGVELNGDFCAHAQARVAATPVAPRIMSGKRPGERTSPALALSNPKKAQRRARKR